MMRPAAALLQVALVAVLAGADSTWAQNTLSCLCGSSGKNYTFQNSNPGKDCRTWSRCLKCQDDVNYCLECPVGLFGSTCSQRERNIDLSECPDPGVPLYGIRTVLRPLHSPPFTRGSHLKFECVKGFYLKGWNSIVCLTGGKWSSPLPICVNKHINIFNPVFQTIHKKPADDVLVNCSNPGPHFNGWVRVNKPIYESKNVFSIPQALPIFTPNEEQYPQETRLVYTCFDGYLMRYEKMIGGVNIEDTRTLECKETGMWSNKPPTCIKACGSLYKVKPLEEWPWIVSVSSISDESSRQACGGVLLNNRTVLTAATCVLRNETLKLLFGKYRSTSGDNDDGVIQRTNFTVHVHPNFNNSIHTADIALIHFSPSIAYSDDIQEICLPTHETKSSNLGLGRRGYVTSWRFTKDVKVPTPYLMSRQTVIPLHSCIREYKTNNLTLPMDPEMFCAEASEAPTNICSEDVASHMLFFGVRHFHTQYTLEGLASREPSSSCGLQGRQTIFTEVLPYVPWIEENMS